MRFRVVHYVDMGDLADDFMRAHEIKPSAIPAGVCEVESCFDPGMGAELVRVSPDGVAVFTEVAS